MKIKGLLLIFVFVLAVSCVTTLKSVYFRSGQIILRDVPFRPGAVAWSPDSTRIAAIESGALSIFNTKTGHSSIIYGVSPYFLEWSPGSDLLAVCKSDNIHDLVRVNTVQETFETVPIKELPYAVKWLHAPDELVIYSKEDMRMSIGTFVTYRLTRVKEDRTEIFFNQDIYFPSREEGRDYTGGWTFAGIRPLHGAVLVPEFHDPPRMEPFSQFKTVDPVTGETRELFILNDSRFTIPSSWSPDGTRLAVTDGEGMLVIVDVTRSDERERMHMHSDIRGRFPSWNPAGSQIYIGGWIVESGGEVIEQLLPDGHESMGIWSPDGTALAILFKNDLFYLNGFSPYFKGEDRPMDDSLIDAGDKIRLLKNLLKEGLINEQEYTSRRTRLLKKIGMDEQ